MQEGDPIVSSLKGHTAGLEDMQREIDELLVSSRGRWQISSDGKGLEATIRFRTFPRAWEFMSLVAAQASLKKHHPEWSNVYTRVFIRWTTHSDSAVTQRDVQMAVFCEESANTLGAEAALEPDDGPRFLLGNLHQL